MTRQQLEKDYFDWLCLLVGCGQSDSRREILACLHEILFTYTIFLDGNREEDGIDLRYRYGDENALSAPLIATYLDCYPCSVLEMMVALSVRIEEHIMADPLLGNRTPKWFWEMMSNLGLNIKEYHVDKNTVRSVIDKFLSREYCRNGKGGLFVLRHTREDVRDMDIWCQMCRYLDERCT